MKFCPVCFTVTSVIYFDERLNRLFVTFNYQLVLLEMKPEITDHVLSHDRPVVAALYNPVYNQVMLLYCNFCFFVCLIQPSYEEMGNTKSVLFY